MIGGVKPHVQALLRAIKIAGSQELLAAGIRDFMVERGLTGTITQQAISKWVKQETLVAAEYWPAIEHVTAGEVTRAQLRPDVFCQSAPQAAAVQVL